MMSGPNERDNDLESRLKDWGKREPPSAGVTGLTFDALSQSREKRNARFQIATTASVLVGAVMLVAWVGTWVNDAAPLKLEKNSVAVDVSPNEQNELDKQGLAESKIDTQTVIYTKTQTADRELQQGWVNAKRNAARDQVLQQWLAENL